MTPISLERIRTEGWLREANFVAGAWIAADDGRTLGVDDPATRQRIGSVPSVGAAETRRAIDAAQAAFAGWGRTTAAARAALLGRMAQIVREHLDPLASLLTFEQGKPLAEARGEIGLGADYLQWFAEEARRTAGEIVPSPWPDRQILVTREPVGVVGAITPWNFPFSMLARKVAPALAAGCTIVVKPSEWDALLRAALRRAGGAGRGAARRGERGDGRGRGRGRRAHG